MIHYAQWFCVGQAFYGYIYQVQCSCGYRSVTTTNTAQADGYMQQHLMMVRNGQIR